jgi:hypothetical protein
MTPAQPIPANAKPARCIEMPIFDKGKPAAEQVAE